MNIQIKLLLLLCIYLINTNEAIYCQKSSRNGMNLTDSGTVRIFVVFAEVINDPEYNSNNRASWPPGQMPLDPDSFLDVTLNPAEIVGKVSQLYHEASFGKLKVIGDYYGSLIKVDYNTMQTTGWRQVLQYLDDSVPSSDIITARGQSVNEDFDSWIVPNTFTDFYYPKVETPDDYIDVLYILWRVNTKLSKYNGSGHNMGEVGLTIKSKTGINILIENTDWGGDDWGVVRHEIAHSLLGGNEYHTAGHAAGIRTTLCKQGGYSLLNYCEASGTLYNGFDRWRLGWKLPSKQYYISALDADTKAETSTDLTYIPGAQYHDYILLDFVTTGDVIRIELPYLRSESSLVRKQYLWLENHQMLGNNLDLNKKNAKGIYAYIQVGYDDLGVFNNGSSQYLTFLNGLGNYDITYDANNQFFINSDKTNPFTGNSINQAAAFNFIEPNIDTNTTPWTYYYDKILTNEVFYAQGVVKDGVTFPDSEYSFAYWPAWGTIHDPFVVGRKIGIGSNPSTAPILTYYVVSGEPADSSQPWDNKKIYLNGLSFEVLECRPPNGDIKVRIRYNDFDVNNDVRWCGPIVLKERVDLKQGTITLDQGLTPTRPVNPIMFGGQKIYASPTVFTTKALGYYKMFEGTQTVVKNNSAFVSEQYGSLEIRDDAVYTVKSGSTLALKAGSNLLVRGSGKIEVENGAYICIESGANITLEDPLSVINLRPGYHAGVNPNVLTGFTCSSNPAGAAVSGSGAIHANYNQNIFIQNETINTNRYISGSFVSIGREVTPYMPVGDVLITSGKEVTVDATNDILLDKGFEAALGSVLELR